MCASRTNDLPDDRFSLEIQVLSAIQLGWIPARNATDQKIWRKREATRKQDQRDNQEK